MAGIEAKTIDDLNVHWGDVGVYNATITAHTPGLYEGFYIHFSVVAKV